MSDTTDFQELIALAHEHCRAVAHYDGHPDGYEFNPDGLAAFASALLADRASRAPADDVRASPEFQAFARDFDVTWDAAAPSAEAP